MLYLNNYQFYNILIMYQYVYTNLCIYLIVNIYLRCIYSFVGIEKTWNTIIKMN